MAGRWRLCFVSSCKINHFGINPVKGGRPPSDNNTRAVVAVKIGPFDQAIAREVTFVIEETFRVIKAADVMKI